MEKILGFIYDDMADFEMTLALNLLAYNAKKEIIMIAYENRPVVSGAGLLYQPHCLVNDALEMSNVHGLIIPGGWNDEQSEELSKLIQKLHSENKLLAAICRGPSYLARAGVLDNVKYTTSYSEDLVKELGVQDPFNRNNFLQQNVVRDEHIITADGNAFVDFAMEILDYFSIFEDEEEKNKVASIYKGFTN